jgi:hypothetical protein
MEEVIFAEGHEYFYPAVETINPTCQLSGGVVLDCKNCEDYLEFFPVDPIDCIGGEPVVTPATCTEEGEQTRTCSECNNTDNAPIPMINHDWGDGEKTKDPSCTVAGEKTFSCSVCGDTTIEKTAANGHVFGVDGKCTVCNASSAYVLTVIAADRNVYQTEVLNYVPEAEPCETAVLQIVLSWSATDNAYKITEWSKK